MKEDIPILITVDAEKFIKYLSKECMRIGNCETCNYWNGSCESMDGCDYVPTDRLIREILQECMIVEDGGINNECE